MVEGRVGEENCWHQLMSEQGALGSFGFINPAWQPKLKEAAKSTSTNQYHVEIMVSSPVTHDLLFGSHASVSTIR